MIRKKKNTADIPSEAEEKLKEQTQELCTNIDNSIGWINVPETKINYPVMYSGDNEFYLHRAVDGSYLRVGSIFLDYRCNADFTGKNQCSVRSQYERRKYVCGRDEIHRQRLF